VEATVRTALAPPCAAGMAADTRGDARVRELFDERFYLRRYPDVADAVRHCVYRSGLDHFLLAGMSERRDPAFWFSDSQYLNANPDVALAVAHGTYRSGFDHYAKYGMGERRAPSPPWFDETLYLRRYPDAQAAVTAGVFRSGLEHYVLSGRARGYRPEARSDSAVQTAYRGGVPHTDAQGNVRTRYDPASFFPRCLYHAIAGSFRIIEQAGFNCVYTWEGDGIGDVIAELRSSRLQLIKHWPTDSEVRTFASDPNILGWYLDEEPTGQTYSDMRRTGDPDLMTERYRAFLSRKAAIKAIDPRHPVFPLDASGIPPGFEAWWDRWNTSGDISAQDNYPLRPHSVDVEGLSHSVLRAVRLNGERKPVWLTAQAYGEPGATSSAVRLPNSGELRGMVFTAIIHGATGITLFAYDSKVTREGFVIGIAPGTPERYGSRAPATPSEVERSRALWAGAAALNAELDRLTPRLLSPTAGLPYDVYFSGESRTRSPIRTMLKQTGGLYTLLASNIENRSFDVRIQFASRLASVKRLEGNGSATSITPSGGMFGDSLGPFAAAVYEIRLP
jgi:hypothetical protein